VIEGLAPVVRTSCLQHRRTASGSQTMPVRGSIHAALPLTVGQVVVAMPWGRGATCLDLLFRPWESFSRTGQQWAAAEA